MSADFEPDESPFHEPTDWPSLYRTAVAAGTAVGLLVGLDLMPAIPQQLTAWLDSLEDRPMALLVCIVGGAVVALALTAVAHLGVRWQLRQPPD